MKKNEFALLGVSDDLAEALHKHGLTEPTPVQREAIPSALSGKDIIAQAQTGTGKTLAFVLPILETIDPGRSHVQALIVTPTRELAIQITEEVKRWAPLKGVRVLSAYGGQDVERQIRKLEGSIHIIVATPGRLLDHLRRGTVQLHKLSILVLDEADQMLHMGFFPDVEEIISATPTRRQTLLFSATMPPRIRELGKEYMRQPAEIEVKAKRVTLDEIEQVVLRTTDRGKLEALCKIIDEENPYLAMIFCRTKLRASKLNNELNERGYASDELHGDLTQAKREQVMKRFREAKIQYLVATDVAARGLDVEGITHVFNYDIPHDAESYIHRIGRTGRAGQTGKAITFAAPRDANYLELIEKGIKSTLTKRSGKDQEHEPDERSSQNQRRNAAPGERSQQRRGRNAAPGERTQQGRGRNAAPGERTQQGRGRNAAPGERTQQGRGRNEASGERSYQGRERNAAPGERSQQGRGRNEASGERSYQGRERNAAPSERSQQGRGRNAAPGERSQQGRGRNAAPGERSQQGRERSAAQRGQAPQQKPRNGGRRRER
ncbi:MULTISPECIES: DEAD/DEAH box helicase [unclassified Paenibacillus]|uniref:DEAD/DEAH box helicase n=1 Tax=unclassified Paenibacillus TaxID=185978 RepID=UPI001AE8744A|nr:MULTISPECIES: DEAD/DEAH box helicase [unclassified Paenibacillus]MBP1157577.1 ATP-dependent RNA helicase DeaD [Paenibacillus sp. PvP091]MBP1171686.1 ATP-dependent RNA helicase DeaD [Paenibacillus sp. PvR098]MBP2438067.1 ATP-dependent RNA helicase DeaD [Paenibacillus sp. PvP052]